MTFKPIYRQLASHYLSAIECGTLKPGDRLPSIRLMMEKHSISLSTAVQVCRQLEEYGVLEARPRSGNFVRKLTTRHVSAVAQEQVRAVDMSQYVGIHEQVSTIIKASQRASVNVNLASAYCTSQIYPIKVLQQNMANALRRDAHLLGVPSSASGDHRLRELLARRALNMRTNLTADKIVITHGATEALNLALRAVTQPGDVVAVESPTFYGLLQILESLNLRVLEIPTEELSGVSLPALRQALTGPEPVQAVVIIANLHNPLGTIMSDAHKRELVMLCAEHEVTLIEDDTYSELADTEAPLSSLKRWDTEERVIYCASLNKALAPGLRLGWIAAGRWHDRVEMFKYTQSRGCDLLPQMAVAQFMNTPSFERYLRRLRSQLTAQRHSLREAVLRHFPEGTTVTTPQGGTLLWVSLPIQGSSMELFYRALERGIRVTPGRVFSNAGRYDNFVRLGAGAPHSPDIERAITTLGELVARQML